MGHYRGLGLALTATVLVSGCFTNDYIRDRGNDYLEAQVYPSAQAPEGIDGSHMGNTLVVPPANTALVKKEEFEVPRPERQVQRTDDADFSIASEEGRRWILAERDPSEVWPLVRRFWSDADVDLVTLDPRAGRMQTQWLHVPQANVQGKARQLILSVVGADALLKRQDSFQIMIQQGLNSRTTEVHVLHASAAAKDENPQATWLASSEADSSVQAAMLNELLVYLSEKREESVSLLATELSVGNKAKLIEDGNGNPILQLSLSYNRSWAAIGRALERSGIVASDRDRTAGIYYIPDEDYSAAEEAEEPGFFTSMFSSSESQDALIAPSQVELRLIRVDGKIQVSVSKDVETLLPIDVSKSLLTRLRDNLS